MYKCTRTTSNCNPTKAARKKFLSRFQCFSSLSLPPPRCFPFALFICAVSVGAHFDVLAAEPILPHKGNFAVCTCCTRERSVESQINFPFRVRRTLEICLRLNAKCEAANARNMKVFHSERRGWDLSYLSSANRERNTEGRVMLTKNIF